MLLLLPSFLLILCVPVHAASRCTLRPDPGFCLAYVPSWYFNATTLSCTKFIYGGCGGRVPYVAKAQCEADDCPSNACFQKPETGLCRARKIRWYYNSSTGACETFTWGGCRGSVPFQTEKECRQGHCNPLCTELPDATFSCATKKGFFYNNKTGKCTPFRSSTCGSPPIFGTLDACKGANCLPTVRTTTPKPPTRRERCSASPDRGPCFGKKRRWHWDKTSETCKSFEYGGCLGTVPFFSKSSCEAAACGRDPCLLTPRDVRPFDVAPGSPTCGTYWTSWYFDKGMRRCKSFSYSGCIPVGPFTSAAQCASARCATRVCTLRPFLTRGCKLRTPSGAARRNTWYFDIASRKCTRFRGDACAHGSVFASRSECAASKCWQLLCDVTAKDVQRVPVGLAGVTCYPVPRPWYFDATRGKCAQFTYGGCDQRMPFSTKSQCAEKCE